MISFVAVGTFGAVVIGVASDVAGRRINNRLIAMLNRICEVLVLRMTAICASEFGISRR
jgi:Flp pilus assembly protein protease CpaA